MIELKRIKRILVMILLMGLYPMIGWAGPIQMTDAEMDGVYAQGIFMDINISVDLPGIGALDMPSVNVPMPNMGGASGAMKVGEPGTISVSPSTNGSSLANNTGSGVSETAGNTGAISNSVPSISGGGSNSNNIQNIIPAVAGVSISKGSMNGNSGLIINAPAAAVSLVVNVAVLNNSTVYGNLSQSVKSIPTTMLMSFTTSFY